MKSLRNLRDPFLAEIAAQPEAIRRAADALPAQRAALDRFREASGIDRTLIFTGMGSSHDACYPIVNDLAGRGVLSLHVGTAELLHFRRPILDARTLLVIVSQSGRSAEIVRLASELASREARPLVASITNGLGNDLARRADLCLDTRAGEEAGPSTKTFVASMTTLAALGGVLSADDVDTALDGTRAAAEGAAGAAERLLGDPEGYAGELAGALRGRDIIVVLGRGPARAAAEMGALTLKESGVMAESLESAMFRHGPFELAGPGMSAIVMATEPETRRLDLALADDLVQAGASVLVVSPDGERPDGAYAVATGFADRMLGSVVSILPVQLLAWKLSAEAGRTPGSFTRASKVTTHE